MDTVRAPWSRIVADALDWVGETETALLPDEALNTSTVRVSSSSSTLSFRIGYVMVPEGWPAGISSVTVLPVESPGGKDNEPKGMP